MKLTALDIRKQEFARTFRGYDADEVDSFLQVIANDWQEMVDELRRNKEKINEQQLKLEHYMKVEEALEEALQTARSSARQTIESAEKKAADMLEEAENRIVQMQKEADSGRLEIKRETARYAVRQQEIVAKLRAFLVSEMEMLRHFESDSGERTLSGGSSRKEIELFRDDESAAATESEANEDSGSGLDDMPLAGPVASAGLGAIMDTDEEEELSNPWDEESGTEGSQDDVAGTSDEYTSGSRDEEEDESEEDGETDWDDEEDWDDDDDEENGDEDEDDDWEEEDEWDDDEPDDDDDDDDDDAPDDDDDDDGFGGSASSDEDDFEDTESHETPGWKVTPVFESADDDDVDSRRSHGHGSLPEDSADDEIKKIHEILKGLDEEQDGGDA